MSLVLSFASTWITEIFIPLLVCSMMLIIILLNKCTDVQKNTKWFIIIEHEDKILDSAKRQVRLSQYNEL